MREREIMMCERNIHWLPPASAPINRGWPITQACALTQNQTSDILLCGMMLNQLSHTGQGSKTFVPFKNKTFLLSP